MKHHTPSPAPLLVSLLLAVCSRAAAADLESAYAGTAESIRQQARDLQREWTEVFNEAVAATVAAGHEIRLLNVTLERAAGHLSLKLLAVFAEDGDCLTAQAWIPAEDLALEVLDHGGLVCAPGGDRLQAGGQVRVRFPRRLYLDAAQDESDTLTLRLQPGGDGFTGTWQGKGKRRNRPEPASARVTGAGAAAVPAGLPLVAPGTPDAFGRHAACRALEAVACGWYDALLRVTALLRGRRPQPYRRPEREPFLRPRAGAAKAGVPEPDAAPPMNLDLDLSLDGGPALDDGGLGLDAAPAAAAPAAKIDLSKLSEAQPRLRDMEEMARHLAFLLAQVREAGRETPSVPSRTDPTVADPWFNPGMGMGRLPAAAEGGNALPPGTGGDGPQQWLHLDRWQILGPFELQPPAARCIRLASMPHLQRARYRAGGPALSHARSKLKESEEEVDPRIGWRPWPTELTTGALRPPYWFIEKPRAGYGGLGNGFDRSCWYAAATVHSDKPRKLWLAAAADDDCMLWLNGRPIAAWPEPEYRDGIESEIMLRVSLQAGRNTFVARVNQYTEGNPSTGGRSCLWVRLCTRGAPRPAEEARRHVAQVEQRRKSLAVFAPGVSGWRGDRGGLFPKARPVTAWNTTTGVNVLWSAALPLTVASPVVAGDLVITTAHPYYVLAFDKLTGERRWRRAVDPLSLVDPEAARTAASIWDEIDALDRATRPQLLGPAPDGPFKVAGKTLNADQARQHRRDLHQRLRREVEPAIEAAGMPTGFSYSKCMGQICATPVTDGRHVWAWTHRGAAACLDLEGNVRWMVRVPSQGRGYGAYSSPMLLDGLLILEVVPERAGKYNPTILLALDAETGEERWRAPILDPDTSGSSVALRLTNGEKDMAVIVSPGGAAAALDGRIPRDRKAFERLQSGGTVHGAYLGGTVVRAADGKVLIPNLSVSTGYGSPLAAGDVVYHFSTGYSTGTRLLMVDRDTVGAQRLFTRCFRKGFEPGLSLHEGVLHAKLAGHNVGGQGDGGYGLFDARTGARVPRRVNWNWTLRTTSSSRSYVPTAIAGDRVFWGDEGEGFGGKGRPHANMTVIEAGPGGRVIAFNGLPPRTDAGLAFEEDRIYYRCMGGLIGLGYTGPAGRAYEAQVNASTVMEDLHQATIAAPPEVEATTIPRQAGIHWELRRHSLWGLRMPTYHRITCRQAEADRLRPVLTGTRWPPAQLHGANLRLRIEGEQYELARGKGDTFELAALQSVGRKPVLGLPKTARYWDLDPDAPPAEQTHVLMVWFVQNARPETVRFVSRVSDQPIRVWLGGVEVKHYRRYALPPGERAMVVEVTVPPGAQYPDNLVLDFCFLPSRDAAAEAAAHRADLEKVAGYLRRAVELAPDSPAAEQARAWLPRLKP